MLGRDADSWRVQPTQKDQSDGPRQDEERLRQAAVRRKEIRCGLDRVAASPAAGPFGSDRNPHLGSGGCPPASRRWGISNGLHLGEFHECIKHIAQPETASTRVDGDQSRLGQGRMEESEDAQAWQAPARQLGGTAQATDRRRWPGPSLTRPPSCLHQGDRGAGWDRRFQPIASQTAWPTSAVEAGGPAGFRSAVTRPLSSTWLTALSIAAASSVRPKL